MEDLDFCIKCHDEIDDKIKDLETQKEEWRKKINEIRDKMPGAWKVGFQGKTIGEIVYDGETYTANPKNGKTLKGFRKFFEARQYIVESWEKK